MAGLQQQSADVRFREIDLSQVIRSNSSSRAAIILNSRKGRLTRYPVGTNQQFIGEYGIPDASISFGHYCALEALKECTSLTVLRVAGTGYKYSGLLMKDNGSGVTSLNPITAGLSDNTDPVWASYISGAEEPLVMFSPKSGPGSYGDNLAIRIRSENIARPNAPDLTGFGTGGTLVIGTYVYRVSAISEIGETLASNTATQVISLNNTARILIEWDPVPGARGYKIYGRTSGSMFYITTVGAKTFSFFDTGAITPDNSKPPITNSGLLPAPSKEFVVDVFDLELSQSTPQETWTCTLEDAVNDNGVQLEITQQINAFSDLIHVESYVPQLTVATPPVKACDLAQLDGGDSGAAPTNGQIAQAWYDFFADPEQVEVNLLINGGYTDVGVQQAMLDVAEKRGDAFAILDTPATEQDAQDAITYRQLTLNANTSYGAIYAQDLRISDSYNGKRILVPPSGTMAAVYAYTDRVAGPQFQPAGLNRGILDVLEFRNDYTEQERTDLFLAQVNYMRKFKGNGNTVFEAVTLQGKQSALSWVSVRRMLNVIKTSVKQYLMYSIHEPNDDFTRRVIVTGVSDYLQYWKDARGLLDYSVVSNKENNPDSKYNLGILVVTIFVKPVIPVHEIQVDIVITKAGVSFSELNIQNLG